MFEALIFSIPHLVSNNKISLFANTKLTDITPGKHQTEFSLSAAHPGAYESG